MWILPIAGEEVRVSPLTYGGYFKLSDAVYAAHGEYGEMMYGEMWLLWLVRQRHQHVHLIS